MKRFVIILLCITMGIAMLAFSSYSSYENATFIDVDGEHCLLYQEEKYFKCSIFATTEHDDAQAANENEVQIGWFYSFPFSTYFYSYTVDDPHYICTFGSDTGVYFKQDYDYRTDTFSMDGTTHEFVFSDAFTSSNAFRYDLLKRYQDETEITLYPKQYPQVWIALRVFCVDDVWYAGGRENGTLFEVSADFVKMFTARCQ